ncbi:hypothetical protein [Candidatus Liberibacter brunswickensis]
MLKYTVDKLLDEISSKFKQKRAVEWAIRKQEEDEVRVEKAMEDEY